MDKQFKRVVTILIVVFTVLIIVAIVYALIPKKPSTQASDKTVIIQNYSQYTEHISPDSFGYLGNYLYKFIKEPSKGIYEANIVANSYTYTSNSQFSNFIVKLEGNDIAWKISMQTLNSGEINGDVGIFCHSGGDACLSVSSGTRNAKSTLQSKLPITTNDFIISNQLRAKDKISVVYYDQEGTGKTKALDKIKELGFKPEDYTIEYFYGGR